VATGNCYQYRYLVSDNVGNQAIYTSPNVAKVDTTAPAIAAAIATKPGGSTNMIRQGGDYYVHAQVTDNASVSTVTANTSSFDTGITAAPMTTTGGPWTVNGVSYNYRSASAPALTANTGLTTGTTPTYTITARDAATNTAGPTSYTATIETYNNVITTTAGLVSFWRFNDLTTTVTDARGTNNGSLVNGPLVNQAGALAGDANKAVLLDGTDDYVSVPDANTGLDLADGPLTLEAWVKRPVSAPTGSMCLFDKGAAAYQFCYDADKTAFLKNGAGSYIATSSTTVTDTGWHHLVVTKTAAATKLYIDGNDLTVPSVSQTLANNNVALIIGAVNPGSAGRLRGTVDEFAVYNSVLTPAQVMDHFKAGAGTG
jgi:hypothetical protein